MINEDVEYDIIFVDGLHVEEQARRDIELSPAFKRRRRNCCS